MSWWSSLAMNTRCHRPTRWPPRGGEPWCDPWPSVDEPCPAKRVVAFPGIGRWWLRTTAEHLQPARHLMAMVVHTKGHHHHRAHAATRPALCLKARLQGTLAEQGEHVWPWCGGKPWRPPQLGAVVQTPHGVMVLSERPGPYPNGHPPDTQLASHRRLSELPGLQPASTFQAAFFKLAAPEISWSPYHSGQL